MSEQNVTQLETKPQRAEAIQLVDDNFQQVAIFMGAQQFSPTFNAQNELQHVVFSGMPPEAQNYSGTVVRNHNWVVRSLGPGGVTGVAEGVILVLPGDAFLYEQFRKI